MRKRVGGGLLVLALLCICTLALAQDGAQRAFSFDHGSLRFDEAGELVEYRTADGSITLDGILLDAGVDGQFLRNTIGYQRFWDMNTWDLANIVPRATAPWQQDLLSFTARPDSVEVITLIEGMELRRVYTPTPLGLQVGAELTSRRSDVREVQGISLQVHGLSADENTAFRFPGNVPYGITKLSDLRHFAVRQAAYAAPLVRVDQGNSPLVNLVFLHTREKWSTALWRDRDMKLQAAFLAMTEGLLNKDESILIGPLVLQITQNHQDPYKNVRDLYEQQGWHAPTDGKAVTGPLYSAHPHGTMDSGFRDRHTMAQFAETLPGLKDMGVESVWILPIFEHTGRGVYEPTDQALIDPRYGNDEDVRAFSDKAHDLGINLLFDYVPHGPYPTDPLAKDNPQWCSIHRKGHQQIEWDCVSFDMANPDYQDYTTNLVLDHIKRFEVDGGRIDCAMGGLSNWQPVDGNLPSSSGLQGGVEIVSAIRKAFTQAGKQPLLLPENFHPLPVYAPLSDIFYDMPLYRAMFDMRQDGLNETDYAKTLAQWLADEQLSGVPGLQRLRFLGNHDTVSWTWDRQRATQVYGEDKAKALWTLFSFIDGVPFLYQGDELSSIYDRRTANDLRPFFTDLFSARKEYLHPGMDIAYEHLDSALVAFTRFDGEHTRLALVNLGQETVTYPLEQAHGVVLYGQGSLVDGIATLEAYQSLLIDLP